jgi:hypothetical protein
LRAAGVSVAAQELETRDRGVDFAVWADELAHVIGGPLLVEVKAGRISPGRLQAAELQITNAMAAMGGRLGLLLYLDSDGRRYSAPTWETPFVMRFDLEDFALALLKRPFARLIVELRNRLVHGAG